MSAKTEYPGEPVQRLKILLRSGNAVMVDGVTQWSAKHLNGKTISLKLEQILDPRYARVVVESIDLNQIEGIVILPAHDGGRRGKEEAGA